MKIALFGGTFNPPHIGHVQICEVLLKEHGFDQVWVLVCYRHPFGKHMAPFWDRFKMVKRALRGLSPRVRVMDLERRLGGVSYSLRTVRHILQRFPSDAFTWIMGDDNMTGGQKWRGEEEFKALIPLLTIPRGKNSQITDISSQHIREHMSQGRPFAHHVPAKLYPYIARRRVCFLDPEGQKT